MTKSQTMSQELEQGCVEMRLVIAIVLPEGLPGEASITASALESGYSMGAALRMVVAIAGAKSRVAMTLDQVCRAFAVGASGWPKHVLLLDGLMASAA